MTTPEPSKYTMPLNQLDIYQTAIEWRRNQGDNYTAGDYAAPFIGGYNQGVIDALHYVGKQDQICWNNGYAEAKREMAAEPGIRHVYTDADGTELACRIVCDTPHGAWFLAHDQIGTHWEARNAQAEYERGVGNGFASATNRLAAGAEQDQREHQIELGYEFQKGIDTAHGGVQDVMQPEDSNLDFFLGDGEKPVCRIQWFHDPGDDSVGLYPRCGWVLADDQSGTELEHLLQGIGLIEKPELKLDLPPDTDPDPDFRITPSVTPDLTVRTEPAPRYFIHSAGNFNARDGNDEWIGAVAVYEYDGRAWYVQPDRSHAWVPCDIDAEYIERHLARGNIIEHEDLDTALQVSERIRRARQEYDPAEAVTDLPFDTFPKIAVDDAPEGWIAVPDDAMECPVPGDTKVIVRLFDGRFPMHDNYFGADGWHWNNQPGSIGRITHYKIEPKETSMGYDFPATARIFKRKHSTGLGKLNYAVIFDDGSGSWVNDEGEVHLMDEMYSMRLDEFETCAQMGVWSEITEADLPPYKVRSENVAAGLEQPWLPVPDDYMRCPLYDDKVEVEVKLKNGGISRETASWFTWNHDPSDGARIIAYRVPAWKDDPEPELSGESDPTILRLEERIRVLREALVQADLYLRECWKFPDDQSHVTMNSHEGILTAKAALALPPVQ